MTKNYNLSFDFNFSQSLIWQYDNSPNFAAYIQKMQDFYDESTGDLWSNWINDVLNIQTANEYGLTLWGLLLNLERPVYVDSSNNTVPIPTEAYRLLLNAKIYKNSHKPSFQNCNSFIRNIFFDHPNNNSYVIDNQDMTIRYVVDFYPTEAERIVLNLKDFLPRPSGVGIVSILPIPPSKTFGFNGSGLQTFNNGVFLVNSVI